MPIPPREAFGWAGASDPCAGDLRTSAAAAWPGRLTRPFVTGGRDHCPWNGAMHRGIIS